MSNRVIAFNVTGKPVKKFLSVSDCARKEGISMSVLRRQIVDGSLNEETGHFYDYELRENTKNDSLDDEGIGHRVRVEARR